MPGPGSFWKPAQRGFSDLLYCSRKTGASRRKTHPPFPEKKKGSGVVSQLLSGLFVWSAVRPQGSLPALVSCRSWLPQHCHRNDCHWQCTWISQEVRRGLSVLPYRQENELAAFLTNSSPTREPGWKLVCVHFF